MTASAAAYASRHQNFSDRVAAELVSVAETVLAETGVQYHDQRVVLAQKCVQHDKGAIDAAIKTICAINSDAIDVTQEDMGLTDAQINAAVAAQWNTLAAVDVEGSTP